MTHEALMSAVKATLAALAVKAPIEYDRELVLELEEQARQQGLPGPNADPWGRIVTLRRIDLLKQGMDLPREPFRRPPRWPRALALPLASRSEKEMQFLRRSPVPVSSLRQGGFSDRPAEVFRDPEQTTVRMGGFASPATDETALREARRQAGWSALPAGAKAAFPTVRQQIARARAWAAMQEMARLRARIAREEMVRPRTYHPIGERSPI